MKMMQLVKRFVVVAGAIALFVAGCTQGGTPKPRGFFRIDLPEKEYVFLDSTMPYGFEYPVYGRIETDVSRSAEPHWINLYFPRFKARVHISYKEVDDNLYDLLEDNIRFAYNHVVKADAIEEMLFFDEEKNVYGMLFEIKGDAASPVQFLVTDSARHFLRGSLYFQVRPNRDSLNPVIDFITDDVIHLMETIKWND
ncbi:gliding motility lipoprotein GldD [Natronoflexus pectinivorans]|nr:gliding motility lipoprotein GldD [Natronoflexus pectinivorans]